MKRGLFVEVFLAMLAVALVSVGIAGLMARRELSSAFGAYLTSLPTPMGRGMGPRMMLGGAEQTFLATVDRGILFGSVIAFALAALAALAFAYYLTRPLDRLTIAAQALAAGDLDHRVEVVGANEIRRLGDAFNDMASSLEQAEELRKRLVADVAHELRNPIAALRAQIEGMAEGVLPADSARLASIAEDTRDLTRLVQDLQELAAADAGQLRYDMQVVDLVALACHEVERITGRRSGIEIGCTSESPVTVIGDEGRLSQVLRNLLENALRHTSEGRIDVICGADEGWGRIEVCDTGEGIPAADLPFIFERFYRADSARAADTGGSGVGLAVSRRIVRDHGGDVFASNREGTGACVGFRVPLATRTAGDDIVPTPL